MAQSGGRLATLDPKLDIVFWMLFGAEQNRALLIALLNAVLRPLVPIDSVEVLPVQPETIAVEDKQIALDLRVRLQNGEQVDVEMQSRRHPALRERGLYYWARLYSGQLLRGAPYVDLVRCVVVLITDFVELSGSRFHSVFCVQEVHGGDPLTDHLELHFLELPKLSSALDRNDEPNLAAWCRFLAAGADEDLEELAMENPIFKQAKDALERLSADPDARLRAEQREMALLTYEAGLTKVRREGRAEGRVQGKAALLSRQLTLKFGQLPAHVAQRLADATETELDRWSERVLSADALEGVFGA